jgi:VWFA-related protein
MTKMLFALAAVAVAQEPIRVTTRLIETSVIVRDHKGPVGDLTADSFKIFDNGKEQKIAVFRVSKADSSPASATPALPAGVFSNRISSVPARPARHTVLVVDTLNTDISDQPYVRKQILAMLASTEIQDPTAIYVLGQKSRLIQDFTLERDQLTKAMEAFRPEQSRKLNMANQPTPTMPGGGPTAAMARQSFGQIRVFGNKDRAFASLDALEDLGKYLAHVPGKKSIIWISNAFPAGSLYGETDRMQVLDRADVAIYGVDARGLSAPMPHTPPSYPDTLNWVAEETGGRAFYNRNDIGEAIHEAIEDGEVSYTLGFYAKREKPDGNFHTLKVKVDRPGIDVRHRAGYFDAETKLDPNPAAVPEDASEVGLVAAIARAGANFHIAVQVNFKDLRLESENGRWKGSAELEFASQSGDGRALDVASKKLTFDMTNDAYQTRQREGFAVEQMIPVKAGTAKIRVVIVDRSGAAGSVSITPPK